MMRNQTTYVLNQNNKHCLQDLFNDLNLNTNSNGLGQTSNVQEISQSLLVNIYAPRTSNRFLLQDTCKNTQKLIG